MGRVDLSDLNLFEFDYDLTFMVFFLNAHASMLAIIFTRHGLVLHEIGWLLSLHGVPVVLFTFATGTAAAVQSRGRRQDAGGASGTAVQCGPGVAAV